jgi:hypothetical protein
MTERWDLAAEQVTLGGMLLSPAVIADVTAACSPRDFYRPAHGIIAEAILRLHGNGSPCDAVAVAAFLGKGGDLARCGGAPYLHTLIASVPVAANAGYYARIVRDWAVRRRIEETGTRMAQRSREPGADVADILAGAGSDLAEAVTEAASDVSLSVDAESFCEMRTAASQPVIPGLVWAQERVIVVADEGAGKSTLARQAWAATGAGVHLFTGTSIPPMRTLLLDFENPRHLLEGKIPQLLEAARKFGKYDRDRMRIWHRPGGVDLSSPADQSRVTAVVADASPDLICAGPIYKMTRARGERAEPAHSAVAAYLDTLRENFGAALWLETHAPMKQGSEREMRPLDWGGWLRWPEFGLALRVESRERVKVRRFRGDRDEGRLWPSALERAPYGGQWPWPWAAVYPDGTMHDGQNPW